MRMESIQNKTAVHVDMFLGYNFIFVHFLYYLVSSFFVSLLQHPACKNEVQTKPTKAIRFMHGLKSF